MQLKAFPVAVFTASVLVFFASTAPAASAQDTAADVAALRAEIRALRADLEALRRLVESRTPEPPASPDPVVEMLQQQVAEQAQVKVESRSRMPVRLSGTIVSNTFFNSGEANWGENPNIVAAPAGPAGSFGSTVRQTHVGLSMDGPALGAWQTSGFLELDLLGGAPGFPTGIAMGLPRVRYAFARIERDETALVIGQDNMILAPKDPTSLAAPGFPLLFRSGNLYLRAPQIRVDQQLGGGLELRAGLVTPLAGDLGATYLFAPPPGAGERSRTPALQARLGYLRAVDETRRVDVGVSAHYGRERRTAGTTDQWASAVDWSVTVGRIGLGGEAYTGDALSAFGGALGQSVRASGGFAELRVKASDRLAFNSGGGIDRVRAADRRLVPLRANHSWFGNAIVSLTPELATSIEYRHLETETSAAATRSNHHVNLTFAFSF